MTGEVKKEYQWNLNWRNPIAHTDVNTIVAELEEIRESRGEISPQILIESSKNKKSVLHGYFEWDNDKAANKWRLRQASELLGRIEVKVIKNGEPKTYRVYQTVRDNPGDNNSVEYKKFDSLTIWNINFIQKSCVIDLKSIIKRLLPHGFEDAIIHLEKSIEILSKESTETKEEEVKPVLTVAV